MCGIVELDGIGGDEVGCFGVMVGSRGTKTIFFFWWERGGGRG